MSGELIAFDTVCGETPARRATIARVAGPPLAEEFLLERGMRLSDLPRRQGLRFSVPIGVVLALTTGLLSF
ncbi:hypothetical protein GCM10018780_41730 [Streptomyces lanatus]|nr:hypothetical protein GCM10018780_41730 [Streptomyces lanatus]